MRRLWLPGVLLSSLSTPLPAQELNDFRGTWITHHEGALHVLYLLAHDKLISGTFCHDCSNPDTLGFVDDSTLTTDGLAFSIFHTPQGAAPATELATATLANNSLTLTLTGTSGTRTLQLKRPTPFVTPTTNSPASAPVVAKPYVLPAPAEPLSVKKVAGVWLSGNGPGKQYFIFKAHKDGLRGLVCGPCDNPASFAPLDAIRIAGNTLHFDIMHEDNGFGIEQHGPFRNITSAQIARNEMHLRTVASFEPDATPYEMTLLGPVHYMPLPPEEKP